VLYLQLRMFYAHKGTEKLFEHLPVEHGVRLAESISGDSSFAHARRSAMQSSGLPESRRRRAPARCAPSASSWKRIYNHIGDIGAICTDVRSLPPTCTPCGSRSACCA